MAPPAWCCLRPGKCSRQAHRKTSCTTSPERSAPHRGPIAPRPCPGGAAPAGGYGLPRAGSRKACSRCRPTSKTRSSSPRWPANRGGNPMDILAEARGASRRFGPFAAVSAVDLVITRAEVVGLLGANGAGKTTLIRLLLGLLRPSGGVVQLFGSPPSLATRRRVRYVPQTLGLYAGLTLAEHSTFTAAGVPHSAAPVPRRYLRVEERARRRPSARRPTPGRVRGCPLPPARTPDTRRTHLRCRAPWPSAPVGGNPAIRQPRGWSACDDPQHGRSRTVRSPGGDGRRESRGEGRRRRDHRRP